MRLGYSPRGGLAGMTSTVVVDDAARTGHVQGPSFLAQHVQTHCCINVTPLPLTLRHFNVLTQQAGYLYFGKMRVCRRPCLCVDLAFVWSTVFQPQTDC